MIGFIRGKAIHRAGRIVTVDVNGVGYEVILSTAALASFGDEDEMEIVIHTDVHEDAIRLYGFADQLERQVFLLLLRVKGVGARSASDIISQIDKKELLRAIGAGDSGRLQKLRGVGKKTAELMVIELKDKVGEFALEQHGRSTLIPEVEREAGNEAVEALQALGFPRKDAERAVRQAEEAGVLQRDPGLIVKEALRYV